MYIYNCYIFLINILSITYYSFLSLVTVLDLKYFPREGEAGSLAFFLPTCFALSCYPISIPGSERPTGEGID